MRRFLSYLSIAAGCALMMASCAPSVYSALVDSRYPSDSGVDLGGRSMAVVYLDNGSTRDSVFNDALSDGFVKGLEAEFFKGEQAVPVYVVAKPEGADYSCADSLVNLVLDLDSDVIFVLDTPSFAQIASKTSATVDMYVYDSMAGRKDGVYKLTKQAFLSGEDGSMLASDGQYVGLKWTKDFSPNWKTETYSVLYYDDSNSAWTDALYFVQAGEWKNAVGRWMKLLGTASMLKRSCAEYNIALGCYMLGDYELALEWLEQSDRDQVLSLSKGLRSRIEKRMSE